MLAPANPASPSIARKSVSDNAPATQPTHSSMLRRTSGGNSPRTTTSDTAKRPPGLRTRNASAITLRLSPERLITQFEMITSTVLSGSGICSMSPLRNSALVTPASAWFLRASASISSVMSSPYALPVTPTRFADSSTSMPPPEPRSSTMSPSLRSASAVGLPQPSDARPASLGRQAVSSPVYRLVVIGSSQHDDGPAPQQPLRSPDATRKAAAPYFSRTTSFSVSRPWLVIGAPVESESHQKRLIYCPRTDAQSQHALPFAIGSARNLGARSSTYSRISAMVSGTSV